MAEVVLWFERGQIYVVRIHYDTHMVKPIHVDEQFDFKHEESTRPATLVHQTLQGSTLRVYLRHPKANVHSRIVELKQSMKVAKPRFKEYYSQTHRPQ